ncbi:EAL domain-containing protein [Aquincola sp. S2]|uniref:EAL domain-containing protein n=1 Tax=Pseudaquabacterium terrae TaxID=2732868 RepID=A0ABX2ESU5_9BURK|nr:EAL domain-containing protein [Aquabacterium terrae]NRF71822.1 EAL domain-containing protein [Aquabacterium terrae]
MDLSSPLVDTLLALPAAVAPALVEEVPIGIFVVQNGVFRYANAAYAELVGWPAAELIGRPQTFTTAPDFREHADSVVQRRLEGKPGRPGLTRHLRRDGSAFDGQVYARLIDYAGQPAVLVTLLDVSELQQARRVAEWNAGMLARTEALCRSGSFEIQLPSGQLLLSEGLCTLAGLEPDASREARIDALDWVPADERPFVAGFWRNADPGEPFEFQHRVQCADGRKLQVLHRGRLEVGEGGGLRGFAILQDITAQKEAELRIQELANHDEVTGLPNRGAFLDQVDAAMHAARWDGRGVALLALDVRRIAEIKSSMGFGAGDTLAMALAARLRGVCGDGESVAHLGETEFALLIDCDPREAQGLIAQRGEALLRALQVPVRLGSTDVYPQCLIGAAAFPTDADSADRLLECAQTARVGLSAGRGIAFFKPESNSRVLREMALESALSHAIDNGELLLHYQPQVDLASGRVCGAEALLRWRSRELGTVSPGEFIPVAERCGLIGAIGDWVLREACRQIAAWRRAGLPPLRIGVNLSPMQLQPDLARHVQAVLVETGADPASLGFEVTEGTLMADVTLAAAVLRDVKSLGVEISLDDFGTGFSSLSSLSSLPIDIVKVDRSFVHDVTGSSKDVSVTRAVISMAHGLQMQVLAEGLETDGQLSLLVANGCDRAQGYWFSPPLAADDFERLVREQRSLPEKFLSRERRRRTLLLVDDEENILASLKRLLRRDGYHIVTAGSAAEGLQRLAEHEVDVIVSDQRMPGMTGVEFLRRAKELYPDTVRMVLSGYTELQSIIDAVNEGAIYKFLTKPWDDERLRAHVAEAFRQKDLADENRRLSRQVEAANNDLASVNARLEHLLAQRHDQALLLEASAGSMRELIDRLPAAVLGIDPDGVLVFANGEAMQLLPDADSLLGQPANAVLWPALFDATGRLTALNSIVTHQGRAMRAVARQISIEGQDRGQVLLLLPQAA